MSLYEKAIKAGEEGAHVAAVLYGLRSVELLDSGDYREDRAMGALRGVFHYGDGLKKETDRMAVREIGREMFPSLVEKMEIREEQNGRRSTGSLEIQ
jgi:hypothetical protein